jgi:undecaprenyl diphosphate synthase
MSGNPLRHLAVVGDAIIADASIGDASAPPREDRAAALLETVGRAAEIARSAFELAPGLRVVSFFAPETRPWLSEEPESSEVRHCCSRAARELDAAAGGMGARLALRGEAEGLPEELRPFFERPFPGEGRLLLWWLNYGSRDEIARAASAHLAASPTVPITEKGLAAHLDTAGLPDPDLLLFAGGELEPKDFLLWQGSYAEIWYTPRGWLSFAEADLRRALEEFTARQRRFGR